MCSLYNIEVRDKSFSYIEVRFQIHVISPANTSSPEERSHEFGPYCLIERAYFYGESIALTHSVRDPHSRMRTEWRQATFWCVENEETAREKCK